MKLEQLTAKPPPKKRSRQPVTIYLDAGKWSVFKQICEKREAVPSRVFEATMQALIDDYFGVKK